MYATGVKHYQISQLTRFDWNINWLVIDINNYSDSVAGASIRLIFSENWNRPTFPHWMKIVFLNSTKLRVHRNVACVQYRWSIGGETRGFRETAVMIVLYSNCTGHDVAVKSRLRRRFQWKIPGQRSNTAFYAKLLRSENALEKFNIKSNILRRTNKKKKRTFIVFESNIMRHGVNTSKFQFLYNIAISRSETYCFERDNRHEFRT